MQTREQKIEKLTQLVNKFTKFINDYKKPSYNESDLRLEFLNPFLNFGLGCPQRRKQPYKL